MRLLKSKREEERPCDRGNLTIFIDSQLEARTCRPPKLGFFYFFFPPSPAHEAEYRQSERRAPVETSVQWQAPQGPQSTERQEGNQRLTGQLLLMPTVTSSPFDITIRSLVASSVNTRLFCMHSQTLLFSFLPPFIPHLSIPSGALVTPSRGP